MKKRLILFVLEVLAVMSMLGCGAQKYKVNADSGFEFDKKSYAAGEEVTAYFKFVATDTDYNFYCENDDVKIKTDYDNAHGYVITFTMPDHDVTIGVKKRNTMTIDYSAHPEMNTDVPSSAYEIWKCPDCGNLSAMPFCAQCGRKKPGVE